MLFRQSTLLCIAWNRRSRPPTSPKRFFGGDNDNHRQKTIKKNHRFVERSSSGTLASIFFLSISTIECFSPLPLPSWGAWRENNVWNMTQSHGVTTTCLSILGQRLPAADLRHRVPDTYTATTRPRPCQHHNYSHTSLAKSRAARGKIEVWNRGTIAITFGLIAPSTGCCNTQGPGTQTATA